MTSVSSLSSAAIQSQITIVGDRLVAPIENYETQIAADKALISGWGSIAGAVSTLSDSLAGLKDLTTLAARSAISSNSTVATATATNSAAAGTYDLTSISLAKGQTIYSGLLTSASATIAGGAGSLAITLASGKSETVSLGSSNLTLNSLVSSINALDGGVKASVIATKTGARLILASSGTGSSAAFSVSGTGGLAQFAYSASSPGTEIVAGTAANATLTLNGVPLSSTSNTLGSAIAGLTISLASSGNAVVSVSSSPTGLTNNLASVITSLNTAINAIATQTKFVSSTSSSTSSASSAKSGVLLGNFSATNLETELRNAVASLAGSGLSANALGLSITSSGGIKFNETSFGNAFASNATGVESLVSSLYSKLHELTAGAIGSSSASVSGAGTLTGFISAATLSLNSIVSSLEQQITLTTKENKVIMANLANEYTLAEDKASSASITESYLSVFLDNSSSSSSS